MRYEKNIFKIRSTSLHIPKNFLPQVFFSIKRKETHRKFIFRLAQEKYAHNTPYDSCSTSSPLTRPPIDIVYADQLATNIWAKPREESPSMYKTRQTEWFIDPKLRHTLELNSPFVPYAGFVNPKTQPKWEDVPTGPPEITKEQQRERFPVVLSSMTK